jgi:RNA polymerase primary sigma factor
MRQLKITKQVTNREDASLDKYLTEISKENMIAMEEEVELARRIKAGDSEALKRLVSANLRFVVSVAKQYQNQGMALPDLINEGNLGLIKAAQRFDETRGFKFISYAVWWIRQSILASLAENARLVRLPSNRIGSAQRAFRVVGELEQLYGREPSIDELADAMNMTAKDVIEAMNASSRHHSVDAPMQEGEDGSFLDMYPDFNVARPDKALIDGGLKLELSQGLDALNEREREIIEMYFGLRGAHPMNLEEISYRLNLTRERVRQLKEYGIRRIKQSSNLAALRSYL